MVEKQGLSAEEILKGVYNTLLKEGGREINLPSKAMAEIANDSDWHRTSIGYAIYEKAMVLKVAEKKWAIAFGTKCGHYSTAPYNCDIVAIQFQETEEVYTSIEIYFAFKKNSYYRNSIVYATKEGRILSKLDGRFGPEVYLLMTRNQQNFIVNTHPIQYRGEFVDFLCKKFLEFLT